MSQSEIKKGDKVMFISMDKISEKFKDLVFCTPEIGEVYTVRDTYTTSKGETLIFLEELILGTNTAGYEFGTPAEYFEVVGEIDVLEKFKEVLNK